MRDAKGNTRKDMSMRLLALFSDLGLRCAGNTGIMKVDTVEELPCSTLSNFNLPFEFGPASHPSCVVYLSLRT